MRALKDCNYEEFRNMIRLSSKYDFECMYARNHNLSIEEYPDYDVYENAIYAEMEEFIKRAQFNPSKLLELADFLNENELPDIDRNGLEQVIFVAKNLISKCAEDANGYMTKDEIEAEMLYCISYGHRIFYGNNKKKSYI